MRQKYAIHMHAICDAYECERSVIALARMICFNDFHT